MFSSKAELEVAVAACLKLSPKGDCANGPHGPIAEWDVLSIVTDMSRVFMSENHFNGDISKWDMSSVTSMSHMFMSAASFNGDLSNWAVSRVADMSHMFMRATAFNGDLSNWDVSSVRDMTSMFGMATAFNIDISKWNVLSVSTMDNMFVHATSFKQKLCGAAWINSKASKREMFTGSSGSISQTVCSTTTALSSVAELKGAIDTCLKLSL